MKKQIFIVFLLCGFFFQCKNNEKQDRKIEKTQQVYAENNYDLYGNCKLTIFSDSTYVFTVFRESPNYERIEKFTGRCYQKKDTIYFDPFQFKFNNSDKAVIKNNFVEFVDGETPLKIEIKKSLFKGIRNIDFKGYENYAFFTFDQKFYSPTYYGYEENTVKAVDLRQNDLIKVDQILKKCFSENKLKLRKFDDYLKQCIAVINAENEKEVWVGLYCKGFTKNKEYKYSIFRVSDGGNCNVYVKINLDKDAYSELNIASEA